MKIHTARANDHKRVFEVTTGRGDFELPYAKAEPIPSVADPIVELFIDDELGREGFTYRLASGEEGSVVIDQFLDYNEDPAYMHDLMLYLLTVQALERIKASRISKREIIRRLGTSPAQFYRLVDTANYTKSVDAMLELLRVLDCEVDFVVRPRRTSAGARSGASRVSA